jgi:hypothetical protein
MTESTESNDVSPETDLAIKTAIEEYEDAVTKYGGSPCDRYIFMAMHDKKVQLAFVRHIANSELFIGAYCLSGPGIPEEARVVFDFRCLPPRICLLPNLFLVVLNAFTGRVLRLVDPYFPGMEQSAIGAGEHSKVPEQATQPAAHHPSLAAHHPSLAAHHPSLAAHHPSLAAHHPSLAAHHPSLAAHHPSLAAHHPSLAAHHPSLAAHHPSLAAHHPSLAAHHPSLAAHHPSLAAHHPSLAAHHPSLAAHHPSLAAHHPSLAAHHPSLAAQNSE